MVSLDSGLDHGLEYGLEYGLNSRLILVMVASQDLLLGLGTAKEPTAAAGRPQRQLFKGNLVLPSA